MIYAIKESETPLVSLRILFVGVGGQETVLATRLVSEALLDAGVPVNMSEIHGMAQRGGIVETSIVTGFWRAPVIAEGEADILLAFELLEGLRALPKYHTKSWIIASPFILRPFPANPETFLSLTLGDVCRIMKARVRRVISCNVPRLARKAGNERTANLVLVGVLAGTQLLPVAKSYWERAIEKTIPAHFVDANLKAFRLGYKKALDIIEQRGGNIRSGFDKAL